MEMMQMDLGDAMGDSDSDTTVDMSCRQPSGMDTPPPREASPSLPQMEGYNPSDSFSDSSSNLLKSGFNPTSDDIVKGNVIDFSSSLENTTSNTSTLLIPDTGGGHTRRQGSVLDSLLDQKLKQIQKKSIGRVNSPCVDKVSTEKNLNDNVSDEGSDDDDISHPQVDKEGSDCNSEEIMDFGEDEPLMLTSDDEYSMMENTNDSDSQMMNKPKDLSLTIRNPVCDSSVESSRASMLTTVSGEIENESLDSSFKSTDENSMFELKSTMKRVRSLLKMSLESFSNFDMSNIAEDSMSSLAEDRPESDYHSDEAEEEDDEALIKERDRLLEEEARREDEEDESDEEDEEYEVYEEDEFDDEDIDDLIKGEGEDSDSKPKKSGAGGKDGSPKKKRKRVVKKRKKVSDPDADESDSESGTGKERKRKKKEKPEKEKEKDDKDNEKDDDDKGDKKRPGERRNIRKIISDDKLESATKSAQQEEMERIQRLQELRDRLAQQQRQAEEGRSELKSLLEDAENDHKDDDIMDVTPKHSALKKEGKEKKGKDDDVITLSSSDEDCKVVQSDGDEEDDPDNSGLHVKDEFNLPDEEGRVLVNVGHPPEESDIFLAPQLAAAVKPHQIGGIRFLYDNLVESVERYKKSNGFGCILAHSMGLGKTIQVISFIDIVLRCTPAKTALVIVPVNTLQNWLHEFDMWLPCKDSDTIKHAPPEMIQPRSFEVFYINDSHKSTSARAEVVTRWIKDGGCLLLGYEMYRLLTSKRTLAPKPKKKKKENEVIDVEEEDKNKERLAKIQEALMKPGPDMVICDEGHRIKNSHASISQALKNLKTKRRVVLTGYPLQNNLLEYWCMVDFVRPNYLGTKTEFSNMFERPIMNGQCVDSTPQDRKLMRYRAHVLHSLLSGFVQRRGHSVLKRALPPKEEHVILVRMSPIQRKLYKAFMDTLQNENVQTMVSANPLKAFSVCCKIWNHPDVLYKVMQARKEADDDLDIGDDLTPTANTGGKKKGRSGKSSANRSGASTPAPTPPLVPPANPMSQFGPIGGMGGRMNSNPWNHGMNNYGGPGPNNQGMYGMGPPGNMGMNMGQGGPMNMGRGGPMNYGPGGPMNMPPNNMGPNNMAPNNMGPNNMAPNNMGPNNMGPNNMGPNNMGPNNMGLNNMGPNNMGSNMGPNNMGPNTQMNMGQPNMGHQNVGPSGMGQQNMDPNNQGQHMNMGPNRSQGMNMDQSQNMGSNASQNMGPNGPQNMGPMGGPNGPQNMSSMCPTGPQNMGPMGLNGPQSMGPMGPNGPQNVGPNGPQNIGPNGGPNTSQSMEGSHNNMGPIGPGGPPNMGPMGPNGPQNMGGNGPQPMSSDGGPNNSQSIENSQNMGQNGSQNMGSSGPQNMGPNVPQGMGQNGHQGMGPNGSQGMGHSGPQNMGPNGHQGMGPSGPSGMVPNGPQNMGPNGSQGMGNCPQSIGPNGSQNMGSNSSQGMGPVENQNMGPNGPQSMRPNETQNMVQNGPQNMGPNGNQNIGLGGPQGMGPTGLQNMNQSGPQGMGHNGPQGMGASGLQNMGPNNSPNMGPPGPQGMGPTGQQSMDPNTSQNIGPNCSQGMGTTGQVMGPNGPQNIGPNGPAGMGPNNSQNMGPNGPQGMVPSGPQGMGPSGPQNMTSHDSQGMGSSGQGMGPNGPQNMGPQGMGHNGPQNMGPQGMGPNGPQGMGPNGQPGIGNMGPQNMGPQNAAHNGPQGMGPNNQHGMGQGGPQNMGMPMNQNNSMDMGPNGSQNMGPYGQMGSYNQQMGSYNQPMGMYNQQSNYNQSMGSYGQNNMMSNQSIGQNQHMGPMGPSRQGMDMSGQPVGPSGPYYGGPHNMGMNMANNMSGPDGSMGPGGMGVLGGANNVGDPMGLQGMGQTRHYGHYPSTPSAPSDTDSPKAKAKMEHPGSDLSNSSPAGKSPDSKLDGQQTSAGRSGTNSPAGSGVNSSTSNTGSAATGITSTSNSTGDSSDKGKSEDVKPEDDSKELPKKEPNEISYEWAEELLKTYKRGLLENGGKIVLLMALIEETLKAGDKILVFSQSLFTLNLIEEYLQRTRIPLPYCNEYWAKNRSYFRLDGSTSGIERERLINQFNAYNNNQVHVFLLSTRAGCLGINLIGANRVVVLDASWNPCHDCQAVCRVYRYGQQKRCYVYRFVTDNTLEKKIYDRQINKQGMSDRVVDELQPQTNFTRNQVDTLLDYEDKDFDPIKPDDDMLEKYADSVLKKLINQYNTWITKSPFAHESLLLDRKEEKLTKADKRLAKQGYEMEKKMNISYTRPSYAAFYQKNDGVLRQPMARQVTLVYKKTANGDVKQVICIPTRQPQIGNRPIASVRPMMSTPVSVAPRTAAAGGQQGNIPVSSLLRPGVTVHQIQTTTDINIPSNAANNTGPQKIPAGETVLVIKTPKGVYIRTNNGKIFAVRSAPKGTEMAPNSQGTNTTTGPTKLATTTTASSPILQRTLTKPGGTDPNKVTTLASKSVTDLLSGGSLLTNQKKDGTKIISREKMQTLLQQGKIINPKGMPVTLIRNPNNPNMPLSLAKLGGPMAGKMPAGLRIIRPDKIASAQIAKAAAAAKAGGPNVDTKKEAAAIVADVLARYNENQMVQGGNPLPKIIKKDDVKTALVKGPDGKLVLKTIPPMQIMNIKPPSKDDVKPQLLKDIEMVKEKEMAKGNKELLEKGLSFALKEAAAEDKSSIAASEEKMNTSESVFEREDMDTLQKEGSGDDSKGTGTMTSLHGKDTSTMEETNEQQSPPGEMQRGKENKSQWSPEMQSKSDGLAKQGDLMPLNRSKDSMDKEDTQRKRDSNLTDRDSPQGQRQEQNSVDQMMSWNRGNAFNSRMDNNHITNFSSSSGNTNTSSSSNQRLETGGNSSNYSNTNQFGMNVQSETLANSGIERGNMDRSNTYNSQFMGNQDFINQSNRGSENRSSQFGMGNSTNMSVHNSMGPTGNMGMNYSMGSQNMDNQFGMKNQYSNNPVTSMSQTNIANNMQRSSDMVPSTMSSQTSVGNQIDMRRSDNVSSQSSMVSSQPPNVTSHYSMGGQQSANMVSQANMSSQPPTSSSQFMGRDNTDKTPNTTVSSSANMPSQFNMGNQLAQSRADMGVTNTLSDSSAFGKNQTVGSSQSMSSPQNISTPVMGSSFNMDSSSNMGSSQSIGNSQNMGSSHSMGGVPRSSSMDSQYSNVSQTNESSGHFSMGSTSQPSSQPAMSAPSDLSKRTEMGTSHSDHSRSSSSSSSQQNTSSESRRVSSTKESNPDKRHDSTKTADRLPDRSSRPSSAASSKAESSTSSSRPSDWPSNTSSANTPKPMDSASSLLKELVPPPQQSDHPPSYPGFSSSMSSPYGSTPGYSMPPMYPGHMGHSSGYGMSHHGLSPWYSGLSPWSAPPSYPGMAPSDPYAKHMSGTTPTMSSYPGMSGYSGYHGNTPASSSLTSSKEKDTEKDRLNLTAPRKDSLDMAGSAFDMQSSNPLSAMSAMSGMSGMGSGHSSAIGNPYHQGSHGMQGGGMGSYGAYPYHHMSALSHPMYPPPPGGSSYNYMSPYGSMPGSMMQHLPGSMPPLHPLSDMDPSRPPHMGP